MLDVVPEETALLLLLPVRLSEAAALKPGSLLVASAIRL